jgi:hypothetical protein
MSLRQALVIASLAGLACPASAAVTYTYTSANPAPGGFSSTPFVLKFVTPDLLPNSMPLPAIPSNYEQYAAFDYNNLPFQSWSYDFAGYSVDPGAWDIYYTWVVVSTDASGQIVDWFMELGGGDARITIGFLSLGPHELFYNGTTDYTISYFPYPPGGVGMPLYTDFYERGSWSVSLDGFPEPATWAMFIGGFGMIGAAMRLRPRVSVRFA